MADFIERRGFEGAELTGRLLWSVRAMLGAASAVPRGPKQQGDLLPFFPAPCFEGKLLDVEVGVGLTAMCFVQAAVQHGVVTARACARTRWTTWMAGPGRRGRRQGGARRRGRSSGGEEVRVRSPRRGGVARSADRGEVKVLHDVARGGWRCREEAVTCRRGGGVAAPRRRSNAGLVVALETATVRAQRRARPTAA
jgi:hypothetical protein